jgi:hypothetical protein
MRRRASEELSVQRWGLENAILDFIELTENMRREKLPLLNLSPYEYGSKQLVERFSGSLNSPA